MFIWGINTYWMGVMYIKWKLVTNGVIGDVIPETKSPNLFCLQAYYYRICSCRHVFYCHYLLVCPGVKLFILVIFCCNVRVKWTFEKWRNNICKRMGDISSTSWVALSTYGAHRRIYICSGSDRFLIAHVYLGHTLMCNIWSTCMHSSKFLVLF